MSSHPALVEALPPRRYARHTLQLPLTLLLQGGDVILGLTRDLGLGGVGAAIPEAVDLGERVILKILDERAKAELLLLAAVRHRDGFLHGLEFTALSGKQRELIEEWCAKHSSYVSRLSGR